MAAGALPAPGKIVRGIEIGPCVESCAHTDCKQTRTQASALCTTCGKPIGYETLFYQHPDRMLENASCAERGL